MRIGLLYSRNGTNIRSVGLVVAWFGLRFSKYFTSGNALRWTNLLGQRWNRSGFSRPNRLISKSMSVDRLVDWFLTGPVDRIFAKGFCSFFNASNEKFSEGGGGLSEVLKFVTSDGVLRKKSKKNIAVLAKINSILRPF